MRRIGWLGFSLGVLSIITLCILFAIEAAGWMAIPTQWFGYLLYYSLLGLAGGGYILTGTTAKAPDAGREARAPSKITDQATGSSSDRTDHV
ncbi:MAG: hypothetical protein DRJ65_16110 [Acidobacteria bacterium]|nr:MAG: hypothetical protein DRJ65_16110 [Acidobacteriota bacterium]